MTRIVHRRHVAIDGREERSERRIQAGQEQRQGRNRGQRSAMLDRRHEGLGQRLGDLGLGETALPAEPAQLRADGGRERGMPRRRRRPTRRLVAFHGLINT
jgi:hypothetical protein